MFKTFDISPDGLQFDDVFIERPFYVSPSQWIAWGEWVRDYDPRVEVYFEEDMKSLSARASQLEDEVCELAEEVSGLENEVENLELENGRLEDQVAKLQAIVDGRLVE